MDKIAGAMQYTELCNTKPSQRSQTPPCATTHSDLNQLKGATSDHTTTVQNVSPVTVPNVVESGSTSTTTSPVTPETVSAITASSGTLPVITTNTTTPLPPINLTNSTYV